MTAAGDENAPETVHLATIDWQRGKWAGAKGKYSREHLWHLVGGAKLKAPTPRRCCRRRSPTEQR